jgi:GrpE
MAADKGRTGESSAGESSAGGSTPPPADGSPGATAPVDPTKLTERVFKMTRQILESASVISQAVGQAMPEHFAKLNTTFAMLARQVATNDVKQSAGMTELRDQLTAQLSTLSESIQGQVLDLAVERLVLGTLADLVDDLDVVVSSDVTDTKVAFAALAQIRGKLMAALRPLGVEPIHIVPGTTVFDEAMHEARDVESDAASATVAAGVITRVYRGGYTMRGRVIRRAQIVVKEG